MYELYRMSTGRSLFKHYQKKSFEFHQGLCEAFASKNILLWKINNVKLKNFIELHMDRSILNESTLSKNYVSQCYNNTLSYGVC